MKPSIRELEKRLRDEPDNLGLRVMLAGSLHEVGREAEAVDLYRSVAIAYRDQGRTQQAIAVCRSILDIAPDDAVSRALLTSLTVPIPAAPPTATTQPLAPGPPGVRRASSIPTDETPLPRALPHHVADPTTGTIKKLSDLDLDDLKRPGSEPATERVERLYPLDSDTEEETLPQLPEPPTLQVSAKPPPHAMIQAAIASDLFAPIPADRRAAIATKLTRRSVAPGAVVIQRGESTHALVVLISGALDVRIERPGKGAIVVGTIAPGQLVGERSLLGRVPSVLDVVATAPSEIMLLGPSDFYEVVAAFPALWSMLKELAARRTREYDGRLSAS